MYRLDTYYLLSESLKAAMKLRLYNKRNRSIDITICEVKGRLI